jgi:hypothetical protein
MPITKFQHNLTIKIITNKQIQAKYLTYQHITASTNLIKQQLYKITKKFNIKNNLHIRIKIKTRK